MTDRKKPGPKVRGQKKKIISLTMAPDVHALLHQLAAAEAVSASQWVARAVLAAAMKK